jgi:hypothetical protein
MDLLFATAVSDVAKLQERAEGGGYITCNALVTLVPVRPSSMRCEARFVETGHQLNIFIFFSMKRVTTLESSNLSINIFL